MLSSIDKSIEEPFLIPHNHPIYLVSYADKKPVFFKNQNGQAMSAINKGFDHIILYKRNDIDNNFYNKNKEILDTAHGAGLWLWKPYIIFKTMQQAPQESIIVYADSPVIFKKNISHWIKMLGANDILVVRDGCRRKKNVNTVAQMIPTNILEHFRLNNPQTNQSDALWACIVIVKNSETGRRFIAQWLNNCEQRNDMSIIHDQGMLTIAAHQLPQGVVFMDVDDMMEVAKNVHRHPIEEHKSLLPDMVSGTIPWFKLAEWDYNAAWMIKLRSFGLFAPRDTK